MSYKLKAGESGPVLEYRTVRAQLGWALLGLGGLVAIVLAGTGLDGQPVEAQWVLGGLGLSTLSLALACAGFHPPARLRFDNSEGVLWVGDRKSEATIPYDQIDRIQHHISVTTSEDGKRQTTHHSVRLCFRDGVHWGLARTRRIKPISRLMDALESGVQLDAPAGEASARGASKLVIERAEGATTIHWKQRPRLFRSLGQLGIPMGCIPFILVAEAAPMVRLTIVSIVVLISGLLIASIIGRLRAEHRLVIERRAIRYRNTAFGRGRAAFSLDTREVDSVLMQIEAGAGGVRLSFITHAARNMLSRAKSMMLDGTAHRTIMRAREVMRNPVELLPGDVRGRVQNLQDQVKTLDPSAIREAGQQVVSEIERLDSTRDQRVNELAAGASSVVGHIRSMSTVSGQVINLRDLQWADRVRLEQIIQAEIGRMTGNIPA